MVCLFLFFDERQLDDIKTYLDFYFKIIHHLRENNNNPEIVNNLNMIEIISINDQLYSLLTEQLDEYNYEIKDENFYSDIVNNILVKLTLSKVNFPQEESLKLIKEVQGYMESSLSGILGTIPSENNLKADTKKYLDILKTQIDQLLSELPAAPASPEPTDAERERQAAHLMGIIESNLETT